MPQPLTQDGHHYEALIDFANEPAITATTWRAVLDRLARWDVPAPRRQHAAHRFGFLVPEVFYGEPIRGPEPLLAIQAEFRADLSRLTDPQQDPIPSAFLRGYPEEVKAHPPKTVTWLLDKINTLTNTESSENVAPASGLGIPVQLSANGRFPGILPTDPARFVPVFHDLRLWLYFVLANLWVDGLLPRLNRCKTCQKFFLAKTQKKTIFCSQPCGKNATAPARGQRYRRRREAWEHARSALETAVEKGKRGKALTTALNKAQAALDHSFQQKAGPRYEEAHRFLAQVKAQLKREQTK